MNSVRKRVSISRTSRWRSVVEFVSHLASWAVICEWFARNEPSRSRNESSVSDTSSRSGRSSDFARWGAARGFALVIVGMVFLSSFAGRAGRGGHPRPACRNILRSPAHYVRRRGAAPAHGAGLRLD